MENKSTHTYQLLRSVIFIFLIFFTTQLYTQDFSYTFRWTYLQGNENRPAYIIDSNVNFREEPNLNAGVLRRLQRDDVIILVERSSWQKIDNMSYAWYKVRYNGTIGYVYSAYIADQRIISRIDGNEIILYTRSSVYIGPHDTPYLASGNGDILLYVNGRKIDTEPFFSYTHQMKLLFCWGRTTNDGMHIIFPEYYDGNGYSDSYFEFIINFSGGIRLNGIKKITVYEREVLGFSQGF
jgi:hypothetical protein